jgi:hypothetical protein
MHAHKHIQDLVQLPEAHKAVLTLLQQTGKAAKLKVGSVNASLFISR